MNPKDLPANWENGFFILSIPYLGSKKASYEWIYSLNTFESLVDLTKLCIRLLREKAMKVEDTVILSKIDHRLSVIGDQLEKLMRSR